MKKVILHIGHDKTATCSIQDTLKHNSSILDNYGYCYLLPDGHTHHNKLFITLFKENLINNNNLLLTHEIERSRIEEMQKESRDWLIENLLNTRASTIVFSGEHFPNFIESELDAIKAFFNKTLGEVEFEIYAYTRDPVSYASSAYQQRARLFPSDTKLIYFQYEKQIGRYLKAFGQNSMKLFRFEDACKQPKGPVCFLLNKMGLGDDVIDRMKIYNDNESMSDMAVDLLSYINRKIPYTEQNLKKGLRKRFDCKHLTSLPGRIFQLPEKDILKLSNIITGDMIWLKNNFDINYSVGYKSSNNNNMQFDGSYIEQMITALRRLNPIIKKLIYDYVKLKTTETSLDINSQRNLRILEEHFLKHYALTTKLSYATLAYPQKIGIFIYNLLKRSRTLRLLKRRWIDSPIP